MAESDPPPPFSDAHCLSLFEQAPAAMLVLDLKFRIVAVSQKYLNDTMTKREDVIGRGLFEVFTDDPQNPHASGVPNLRASLEYVLRERRPHFMGIQRYDVRRPKWEGGRFVERYWSPMNSPVFNPGGELEFIIHKVEDVTRFVEQRSYKKPVRDNDVQTVKLEEAIAATGEDLARTRSRLETTTKALGLSEARYSAAVRSIQDIAIFMLDPEGYVQTWNLGAERIKGYRPEEIIGRHFSSCYLPEERATKPEAILLRAAKEGSASEECWLLRKDGTRFWAHVTVAAIRDAAGTLLGYLKETRDMSGQKRYQEALLRAKDAAEQASKQLESFSYTVAHDLKAPLRAMNSFSQMLEQRTEGQLDASSQADLNHIVSASQRMAQIIDGLLRLAEVGRRDVRREPVNLTELAKSAAETVQSAFPGRRAEIVVSPGLETSGDEDLLLVLLQNLIGNALKFSGQKEHPKVEVGREAVDGQDAFYVRDNGVGFDAEQSQKLFVPFVRPHGKQFEGTGLGLVSAQRVVERHGGRIWARSDQSKGTTFYFTLPE